MGIDQLLILSGIHSNNLKQERINSLLPKAIPTGPILRYGSGMLTRIL